MPRALIVLALFSACTVRDVTFIGPGVGDAGFMDGPVPGQPMRWLFLLDGSTIRRVDKNQTTGLLTQSTYSMALPNNQVGIEIVTGKDGVHLYVLQLDPINAVGQVSAFQISATGQLTLVNTVPLQCTSSSMALHPQGGFLVAGCGRQVSTLKINADGSVAAPVSVTTQASGRLIVVINPTGTCVFAGEDGATSVGVLAFQFRTDGTLASAPGTGSPVANDVMVSPTGSHVYLASQATPNSLWVGSIQTTCGIGTMSSRVAVGANTYEMLADPSGEYLILTGNDVRTYAINSAYAEVAGSPFFAGVNYYDATIDPAVPDKIYLLTIQAGAAAVQVASFSAGVLAMISGSTVSAGTNSQHFALAP